MIEFQNVSYAHQKGYGVSNLNMNIPEGEFAFLIGPTGSGKTTLMRLIYFDLLPDTGLVKVNNFFSSKITRRKIPKARKSIGMVFQDYKLLKDRNLFENISLPLHVLGFKGQEINNRVEEVLDLVGLSGKEDHLLNELSGGEQQRACIARALIREPDLLLLDEPFSNLDSNIKLSMREEIYKIIKETNTTTILVTHDINDSLNIADRILIFKAGVLQQYDDPVNMYCEPANCYCAKVLGDLNQIDIDNKTFYIRPEKIQIVKESKYKVFVEKCFFQGKEYKIIGKLNGYNWHFFSKKPLKKLDFINIDYNLDDLIFFDSLCNNFFE